MLTEREQLACLVQQWNENRLDLFHLSYPTEDLEVEGVMRFYFQDGGEKVLTKCVRVSSTATTRAVVDALSEKFLPDLKMLSNDVYSLWEVHENGEERCLAEEEKPLLVQLMWHKDDREGRFLLRRDRTPAPPLNAIQLQEIDQKNGRFAKKKEKEPRKKHQKEFVHVNSGREEASLIQDDKSDDIYKQVPFNTFTRTISNPEAVMRKKREKKLETKLKEMTYGGSLKVYGGEIVPSRPYVTILAGMHDYSDKILADALEKYGLENKFDEFMLVEVTSGSDAPRKSMSDLRDIDGRPVGPDECPLAEMAARCGENGFESFLAIKRKPHDYQIPSTSVVPTIAPPPIPVSPNSRHLPMLTIMLADGSLSSHRIALHEGLTEVGSDREMSNFTPHNIYLDGFEIRGRHAAIANMEGVVTLTPSARDAYIEINGVQIMQTEILRDGDVVRIGADNLFRFSSGNTQNGNGHMNHSYSENQQQSYYAEVSESRASTTRCGPSHYGSLPLNGNSTAAEYYPPSVSGSSISSRNINDDIMNSNNNILPTYSKMEPVNLPISIQIGDYNVWDFLGEVMSNRAASSSEANSFRLSPAYSLYLALRFFQTHNKPYSVQFFSRIESNFKQIAQECLSRDELIFWLANASEFNHLIERDVDLKTSRFGKISIEIERIFRKLVAILQSQIRPATRSIIDIHLTDSDSTRDIIHILDTTLRVARNCRLNPALTIQLCGHILHMVNSFIFNNLVAVGFPPIELTSRLGRCLQIRLEMLHRFCEGMGVELAAECHLDRCRQAANLLAAHKNDVATLGSTCYKLNSLQVVHLLSSFEAQDGEIPCDDDVIDRVVRLAEKQADVLTIEDGQRLTLEESDELNLPFLIPQDGYFAEQMRSIPDGLWQYLQQLQNRRLCHSVTGSAAGNQHQHQQQQQQPIVRSVSQTTLTSIPTTQFGDSIGSGMSQSLHQHFSSSSATTPTVSASTPPDALIRVLLRKNGGGIGLSIVAAQGVGDRKMGIYVKKVVEGTPAALDGRLETGDQLLTVNGHSLIGISQEEAAKLMTSSGNEVHFDVRKRAAHRNGLSTWLVSPVVTPSTSQQQTIPPPAYNNVVHRNGNYDVVPPPPPPPPKYPSAFVSPQHLQQHYQHHNMHMNGGNVNGNGDVGGGGGSIRHYRSSSASDLQQQQQQLANGGDPNASFSQTSITSSGQRSSVFDKLPAHYRHSTRPTVIQPARPGAQSPSALRRGAPSPSPSTNLYRPTSASNLFAPPRQTGALAGYSSNAARESTQDLHRALEMSSPLARSTPNEESFNRSIYSTTSHNSTSNSRPLYNTTNSSPRVINVKQQEPAIVRPVELNMPKPSSAVMKGAVPTAITQALQLQQNNGTTSIRQVRPSSGLRERLLQDADVRQLEKTNIALMSYEAVNDELDRLDMRGHRMTEDETRRYHELLNVAADQSRARRMLADVKTPQLSKSSIEREIPIVVQKTPPHLQKERRIETVIDDIPHSNSSIENMSPNTSPDLRKVQFIDEISQGPSTTATLFAADVPLLDSPGIVGTNEIYRDPRQRRLNEIEGRAKREGADGAKLGFRDKQKLFAQQIGEQGSPRQRMDVSSAQRQIETEILNQP